MEYWRPDFLLNLGLWFQQNVLRKAAWHWTHDNNYLTPEERIKHSESLRGLNRYMAQNHEKYPKAPITSEDPRMWQKYDRMASSGRESIEDLHRAERILRNIFERAGNPTIVYVEHAAHNGMGSLDYHPDHDRLGLAKVTISHDYFLSASKEKLSDNELRKKLKAELKFILKLSDAERAGSQGRYDRLELEQLPDRAAEYQRSVDQVNKFSVGYQLARGQKLLQEVCEQTGVYPIPYFFLEERNNAFAYPKNYSVSYGVSEIAKETDDQIKATLLHEVKHLYQNHSYKILRGPAKFFSEKLLGNKSVDDAQVSTKQNNALNVMLTGYLLYVIRTAAEIAGDLDKYNGVSSDVFMANLGAMAKDDINLLPPAMTIASVLTFTAATIYYGKSQVNEADADKFANKNGYSETFSRTWRELAEQSKKVEDTRKREFLDNSWVAKAATKVMPREGGALALLARDKLLSWREAFTTHPSHESRAEAAEKVKSQLQQG